MDTNFVRGNVSFTVCDKINAISDPLKFTVVDQLTNLTASISFTICDKIENLVINGLDSIAFTVCDKVENMGASLGFTICDKADPILEDLSSVVDKTCSINSLLDFFVASDDQIDPLKYTVCDKAQTICDQIDQIFNCPKTPITQQDFDDNGGVLFLPNDVPSVSKNYCLVENIDAVSLTLSGDDTTLDLNNRHLSLSGGLSPQVVLVGERCIVKNGSITSAGFNGVFINPLSKKSQVVNCVINVAGPFGTGVVISYNSISGSGADDVQIVDCCITGAQLGVLSRGSSRARIINCDITGELLEGVITFGKFECYENCKIRSNSTRAVHLDSNSTSTASNNSFLHCLILNAPNDDGILIDSAVESTFIFGCTIAHVSERAVEDLNATESSIDGASVVFDNFAYDIGDTTVRYNLHNSGVESGVDVNTPPDNLENVFVP